MKVYLVENCENEPGRIMAVFAHKDDAVAFGEALDIAAQVVTRTLFYGQPPSPGYND